MKKQEFFELLKAEREIFEFKKSKAENHKEELQIITEYEKNKLKICSDFVRDSS